MREELWLSGEGGAPWRGAESQQGGCGLETGDPSRLLWDGDRHLDPQGSSFFWSWEALEGQAGFSGAPGT